MFKASIAQIAIDSVPSEPYPILVDRSRRPIEWWCCKEATKSSTNQETIFLPPFIDVSKSQKEIEGYVQHLKSLLSKGKYRDSVRFGRKMQLKLASYSDINRACLLPRAEFDVHYGKALIYTGATENAIAILERVIAEMEGGCNPENVAQQGNPFSPEGRRRNLTLGQAHNHLGYALWMNLGQYKAALEEFRLALAYFRVSELLQEQANTSDSMGRVSALLHQRDQAESLLNTALELRCQLKLDSRIALSLNSLAIAHLIFGEVESARDLSAEALAIFEDRGELRGIGLASITLGRALQQLGGANNLAKAAKHLERAVGTFTPQSVHEPVRLIEARKELGCVYRDLTDLASKRVLNPSLAKKFDNPAAQHLVTAIKLAKGKYPVLYVDSCFDMAQTCFQSQRFDIAESWVKRAQRAICAGQSAADRHRNLCPQLGEFARVL